MFENMALGFCGWDIPAAIVLAVTIAILVVQQLNHNKKMRVIKKQQVASKTRL